MKCPICQNDESILVTNRENIPVFQNRLFKNREDSIATARGNEKFEMCVECGFVWNVSFDSSIDLYSLDYNNSQTASDYFIKYMKSSAQWLKERYGKPQKVIEVGCGRKAEYLRILSKCLQADTRFEGYDPSLIVESRDNITLYDRYFDLYHEKCEDADWIISRHVIEHICNPLKMFENVLCLNKQNDQSVAFFETPDVRWILRNNVIIDWPYEHCSLLSPAVFRKMAKIVDVKVDDIEEAFGGQYMWIFAQWGGYRAIDENNRISDIHEMHQLVSEYRNNERIAIEYINDFLEKKSKHNRKMAIWGAGAKGNVFLNMFDQDHKYIDCVIDINKDKMGLYTSGTGHKIYDPQSINDGIGTIIVMNQMYMKEISSLINYLKVKNVELVAFEDLCKGGI